jgi:hypothetical protein
MIRRDEFPVPSTTTASAGAVVSAPTATINPSLKYTEACCISGPAAVRTVALRMKTGGFLW